MGEMDPSESVIELKRYFLLGQEKKSWRNLIVVGTGGGPYLAKPKWQTPS